MQRNVFRCFLVYMLAIPLLSHAQGAWQPDITVHPRTLFLPDHVPSIQDRLGQADRLPVFAAVTETAFAEATADDSFAERMRRAQIAKNAAFLVAINRKVDQGQVAPLTEADATALRTKAIAYLEAANLDIPSVFSPSDFQYIASVVTQYAQAYDLLAGQGEADLGGAAARLQQLAGRWFDEVESFFGGYWAALNNNLSLRTAGALAMAALVLNDLESSNDKMRPAAWMGRGMEEIHRQLFEKGSRLSEPRSIAGYGEGPWYFRYAMEMLLPLFVAQRHALGDQVLRYRDTDIRTPLFNIDYLYLFDWVREIRMPNGQLPPVEDTFQNMFMPELVLVDAAYGYPSDFEGAGTTLEGQLRQGNYDRRADYLSGLFDVPTTPPDSYRPYLTSAGAVIYRGQGPLNPYAYFVTQVGRSLEAAGGHNHADAMSFLLYAGGETLAFDPGYIQFRDRDQVAGARSHNLILVDGQGPNAGSPGSAGGAEVFTANPFSSDCLNCIDPVQYVELRTGYRGASLFRQALMVPATGTQAAYLVIADDGRHGNSVDWTWQLHGNGLSGTDSFTPDFDHGKVIYKAGDMQLTAALGAANGGMFSTREAVHETTFAQSAPHTVTELTYTNAEEVRFLAALVPDAATQARAVTPVPAPNAVVAFEVDNSDLLVGQAETTLQQLTLADGQVVDTDSRLLWLREGDAGWTHGFLEGGTQVMQDGQMAVAASVPVRLAFSRVPGEALHGVVLADTEPVTLRFALEAPPVEVTGVEDWTFADGILTMTTTAITTFTATLDRTVAVEATELPARIPVAAYPQPFDRQVTLSYTLPTPGPVVLKVWDLLGRPVATLVDEMQGAGTHTAVLDAQDLAGGLYVYRLTHAGVVSTGRLIRLQHP